MRTGRHETQSADEADAIPGLDAGATGPSDAALAYDPMFVGLLLRSWQSRLGTFLSPPELDVQAAARWIYEDAPFCLLVHNTSSEPRFVYANRTAQACFEYDWDAITRLPSRMSADISDQPERQDFVDTVSRQGFAAGYRGLRVSRSGRRFWIEDVTMWQLTDAHDTLRGQAAVYARWTDA